MIGINPEPIICGPNFLEYLCRIKEKQTVMEKGDTDDKVIEVYQSKLKGLLMELVCMVFSLVGVLMMWYPRAANDRIKGFACLLFFGGGGLFCLYILVRNRRRHLPMLVIYDDRVEMLVSRTTRYQTVKYADVVRFRITRLQHNKFIAIDYKPDVKRAALSVEHHGLRKLAMRFNYLAIGALEAIPSQGLTMGSKTLFDLLCQKHQAYCRKFSAVSDR
jgi:hypothetical protein